MIDWIADTLEQLSIAPFWRPGAALAMSAAGSLLTWIVSDTPWAGVILGVSIALAIWAWVESLRGKLAGLAVGLVGYYLRVGMNTTLTIAHTTPYGCVMIDDRHLADCINDATRRADPAPADVRNHP